MPPANRPPQRILTPEEKQFYCHTLRVFADAGVDLLVGGAYAFARYTGIERHTKDLDVFVRVEDFSAALNALGSAGYATENTFPHWLGKAFCGEYFVDVIHGSGNGVARVDEQWFARAVTERVFDIPVRLCPPEEIIWCKAFIQERERFDGADVAHLLNACGDHLDWQHLLNRFGAYWRVLLSHLVLFEFTYPSERERVPGWVMHKLLRRLEDSMQAPVPHERLCRGTLLSRQQYLIDVERRGYIDPRTLSENPMTDDEIATWTAGISRDGSP
jgi:hypothetical protein